MPERRRLTIAGEGRATVAIAAHEMGMGTATAQAQVAADRLGLSLEQVQALYGDSCSRARYWRAASQQTAAIGASIIAAASGAREGKLLKLAGNDLAPGRAQSRRGRRFRGRLCALDDETRRESYASPILAAPGAR